MQHGLGTYYFVDFQAGELVIVPSVVGVVDEARVVIRSRDDAGEQLVVEIPATGCERIGLEHLDPLTNRTIRLERRVRGSWINCVGRESLKLSGIAIDVIRPADWGVEVDCTVMLRDPRTRGVEMRRSVNGGETVTRAHSKDDERELLMEFNSSDPSTKGLGRRVGPSLRWAPAHLRGSAPALLVNGDDGLLYSRRESVTLAPRVLRRAGQNALRTEGFIGAWAGNEPIVEAMDFVLGRQEMLFRPDRPDPVTNHSDTAIYLGRPHDSWGHFLTQGLARVWFALQNPSIPVVWDTPKPLTAHQQGVLDLLGLRNRQMILANSERWDSMIFPLPGVCIGDYVLPGYTNSIGRVPCSSVVPGKRVFLSRSRMNNFPGGAEEEIDQIASRHGFTVIHPQQLSVREQLFEISSSEVVVGVEGSSLHTPLLLSDPVKTRFWALSRHRRGGGLFEHIKRAKGLDYCTLNFLRTRTKGARDPIDIDIELLDRAFGRTEGLTVSLDTLEPYVERPSRAQTDVGAHLRNTQVRSGSIADAHRAAISLAEGDVAAASGFLSRI